jgi:hypothetical protein
MIRRDLITVGVAAVALLGGCLVEGWLDARRAATASNRARTWFALTVVGMLLAAGAFGVQRAHGRDLDGRYASSNPELKAWFDSLKSGKGPCCSDADGSALSDSDWETRGGRYRVRVPRWQEEIPGRPQEMIWLDVPEDAVITEPNRVGRTMVWPIYGYQGVSIRCFMPGSMT